MFKHPDVLIVGGGVIGLTAAYFLAREGLTVEVLDKGNLGAEASWAGAGIIPPGNPENAATPYDWLRATSSRMYPALSAELDEAVGIDNGYRACGGIEYLEPSDRDTIPAWEAEGIAFEPYPSAAERAYLLSGMAQVRNPRHLRALIGVCQKRQVRLSPGVAVARIERAESSVTGVRLMSGELRLAGRYVVAAGAWSEAILEPLGLKTGIHPVRGQIVLLKTAAPSLQRILLVGKNYLVPREDGHVLIGATEEPEAGFEKRTTAEAIAGLIELGTALVPELRKAEMVKCWAGLRPGSLDGLPSIGRAAPFRNLFLAGGHYRAGIQLSPATAQVLTELLTERPPSIPLDDFRPGRSPGKPFRSAFRS